ncbi:ROK family protein [Chloroflexi bacterium TSY]|nr:ROK family protein [Chloroflexi bacterium TSY]
MYPNSVAIGLDIGGTKIAGGLVEPDSGRVLTRRVIPTLPERGGEAILHDSLELARQLIREADAQNLVLLGIGIGVCELVDPEGKIIGDYLTGWNVLPVQEHFSQLAPTLIESDARAAALAEACYGAGKAYRLFAYVTVGTGISYALIQDGQPMTGERGNAILLASMPLSVRCPHCGEMASQVLEEFASGPALVAHYNEQKQAHYATGQEVMASANAGDKVAIDVVESAGEALGNSVGFLVNILDPEAIVVGGGLGLAGGLYWEHFVAATRRHVYASDTQSLPIIPAKLGVDAGLIGAGAIALKAFG